MHKGLRDCCHPLCTRAGSSANSRHKFSTRSQQTRAAALCPGHTRRSCTGPVPLTLSNQRGPTRKASSCVDAWTTRKSTPGKKKSNGKGSETLGLPIEQVKTKGSWKGSGGEMSQGRCSSSRDGGQEPDRLFSKGPS